MNSCNFLGRLTEDPVVHTGFNGTPVVNLELEIEEFRTDSRGDKRRHCTYVDVEAWDTAATTGRSLVPRLDDGGNGSSFEWRSGAGS